MDIVLGVSLTPKTVRLVLVEGEKGDGAIVDHDSFDVTPSGGSATESAADQVVAAVLGTQESASEGGHELKSVGVTWSDRTEAAELRDTLAARGITDVVLVSELHAAGALAQTAGRAVGYESTALLFIDRDAATLSVVRTDDGSIVKVLSQSLHSRDAMAVLADMASAVAAQEAPPEGMFVVGSGVDIASVRAHLETLVAIPVNAPEESGLALARGAAIAAANAPAFDATTAGLAYSQDPDGLTSGNGYLGPANLDPANLDPANLDPANAFTMLRAVSVADPVAADVLDEPTEEGRKPFLLVGSALTSIFVIGVVALAISLAVSIRPTADQRPDAGQSVIVPSVEAPAAPMPEAPQPEVAAPPPARPSTPPETIKAPEPVVQQRQAPPRTVYAEQPAPQAPAPAPQAPVPVPEAPVPAPVPVVAPPIAPYIPPIFNPPSYRQPTPDYNPQWRPPWQQWPGSGNDDLPQLRPGRGYDDDGWPQNQYPQYPVTQAPQAPQAPQLPSQPQAPQIEAPQAPQAPQLPWPTDGGSGSRGSGDRGYDGGSSGRGGRGSSGGSGGCFLIFCSG